MEKKEIDFHGANTGQTGQRYQLRHAAGLYWLLDMEQTGALYTDPIPLNEVGARLWELLASGKSASEVCEWLCETYELSSEQAQQDVQEFIEQLRSKEVALGGIQ